MNKEKNQRIVITTNGYRLFRAFENISHGFADWYQSTQIEDLLEDTLHATKTK